MTAQTLERGIELLRLLSEAGENGRGVAELHRVTGLTKPTIHRLLSTLKRHALVEQVDDSKRYCIGPEVAVLGWTSTRHLHDLKEQCSEDMAALAAATGDTSFLVVKSGYETICIDRQTGSYPVKAFTVDVGARRPLGVGATGIALLAAIPNPQASEALAAIETMLAPYPTSLNKIRQAISAAQRTGYAVSDATVLKGVRGLGLTIRNGHGKMIGAIGVAAITERIPDGRIPEMVRILRSRVKSIEERLANHETKDWLASSRRRSGAVR